MGNKDDFSPIIEQLKNKYFCVSIDLPGHGETAANKFSDLSLVLGDLSKQIESLGEKVNLLGYSQGGRIAFGLALHSPSIFKRLIIESANAGIENEEDRSKRYIHDQNLLLIISLNYYFKK